MDLQGASGADVKLEDYLAGCREITAFCTQNGWIDGETLRVDVLERSGPSLLAAVTFEEVLMEGSGCVAGRVGCYGRVRVTVDENGDVQRLEPL